MERHCRRHQFALILAVGLGIFAASLLAARARAPFEQIDIDELPDYPISSGFSRSSRVERSDLPLEDEAMRRLMGYRSMGACSLESSGYLDLYGRAWGCLVNGDGWSEVLIVRQADDGTSSVQTFRMEIGG